MRGNGMVAALALWTVLTAPAAAEDSDAILGTYLNEKETAHIEIFKEQAKYFGRIVWHKENRKDYKNPDPDLRERPLVGLVFLKDFVDDPQEKEWTDGQVSAPDDGSNSSGYLWLEEGVLKVRGYVGLPLFGRTATLTPIE